MMVPALLSPRLYTDSGEASPEQRATHGSRTTPNPNHPQPADKPLAGS